MPQIDEHTVGLHDHVFVTVFTDEGFNQSQKSAKVIGSRTVNDTMEYQVLFNMDGENNFGCWVNASEITPGVEDNGD